MVFTKSKKKESQQMLLDVREAFSLWDILKSKYDFLELFQTFENLTHDKDLQHFINQAAQELKGNIKMLASTMQKYQVSGPDQGRLPSNWDGNPETFRDELIAQIILVYYQEHLENVLRAFRTSVTNDEVREIFHELLLKTSNSTSNLLKYMKVKGWVENCPAYLNTPPESTEILSCASASHLWDHLTFRYDSLRKTKLYKELVHDIDFGLIIGRGIKKLEEETTLLEKECQKFGLSMPKRPAEVVVAPTSASVLYDDQLYRDVFSGLQGAMIMHAEASKECFVNDRIRHIFDKMMLEEMDFLEQFIRFGKVKGWLHPVPSYRA